MNGDIYINQRFNVGGVTDVVPIVFGANALDRSNPSDLIDFLIAAGNMRSNAFGEDASAAQYTQIMAQTFSSLAWCVYTGNATNTFRIAVNTIVIQDVVITALAAGIIPITPFSVVVGDVVSVRYVDGELLNSALIILGA